MWKKCNSIEQPKWWPVKFQPWHYFLGIFYSDILRVISLYSQISSPSTVICTVRNILHLSFESVTSIVKKVLSLKLFRAMTVGINAIAYAYLSEDCVEIFCIIFQVYLVFSYLVSSQGTQHCLYFGEWIIYLMEQYTQQSVHQVLFSFFLPI